MAWISNAEGGDAVRAKLNAVPTPISTFTISSPLAQRTIALPSGYTRFWLEIDGLTFSQQAELAFALSINGGASFISANNDTYHGRTPSGAGVNDVMDSGGAEFTKVGGRVDMQPGGFDVFALRLDLYGGNGAGEADFVLRGVVANGAATTPPVSTTVNAIVVQPLANGDPNSPSSTTTMTAGRFTLFGNPTA